MPGSLPLGRRWRGAALVALLGLLLHLGLMASPAHPAAAAHAPDARSAPHAPQTPRVDRARAETRAPAAPLGWPAGGGHPTARDAGDPAHGCDGRCGPSLAARLDPGAVPEDCAVSPAPAPGTTPLTPPLAGPAPVPARFALACRGRPLAHRPRPRPPPGEAQAVLQVFLV